MLEAADQLCVLPMLPMPRECFHDNGNCPSARQVPSVSATRQELGCPSAHFFLEIAWASAYLFLALSAAADLFFRAAKSVMQR